MLADARPARRLLVPRARAPPGALSPRTRRRPPHCSRPLPPTLHLQLRAYTHLTETLNLPSHVGGAVHQSLEQPNAVGLGDKYIASLVTSQELLTGVKISTLPLPPRK